MNTRNKYQPPPISLQVIHNSSAGICSVGNILYVRDSQSERKIIKGIQIKGKLHINNDP